MEGVRLGRDELIRQFGISQRLAARVGALLGQGLSVSAALLEIAGPGSAAERLLLLPRLLELADRLNPTDLTDLAREARAGSEGPFAVVAGDAGRVLALEEERQAERAWKKEPAANVTALAHPQQAFSLVSLLDERESRQLFDAEEIARLKLEALAGRDAEARASALRKLSFAPLGSQEKGGIFLRALLEGAPAVRAEAIRGMESLGFDRDTADAMQGLFEPEERARAAALRRIGDLLNKLPAPERRVVLAVLVEALREAHPVGAEDPLLRLVLEAAPLFAEHPELAPEAARVCVQHLLAEPQRLGPAMRDLLLQLARVAPEPVLEKLWSEAETVTAAGSRALLLGLLIETETRPALLPRLAETVTQELVQPDLEELPRQKLGHNLVALGAAAVAALLKRFDAGAGAERAALVPFLDALGMAEALPARDRERIARAMLEGIQTGDARLRLALMGTRTLVQSDVGEPLHKALAAEALPLLRAHEFPELAAQAAALLEKIGPPAAPGLFDLIAERPNASEADTAARVLGRILRETKVGSPLAKLLPKATELFSKRLALPANPLGGYAEALGWITLAPAVTEEEAGRILDLLMQRFGRTKHHGDMAEAIGRVAGSGKVDAERRVRVTRLLCDVLVQSGGPEKAPFRAKETPKGKVYQVTGRVEFDSDTLPAAVHGLEQVTLAEGTPEGLRAQMTDCLLHTWEEVAAWRMVWGPRAAETLAATLGRIGADARCDEATRLKVISALARAPERFSAVRALGQVFDGPMRSEKTGHAAVVAALEMLEHWIEPDVTPEELEAVLAAASSAAANAPAPARSADARRLQKRTVELLLDAFRAGKEWARPALEKLRDAPRLPRKLRDEIAERLERGGMIVDM